jgi:VanZ family protein
VALRALIHLVEYGVLGLLAHRALRAPGRGRLAALGLALGLCLAVAGADESIQATQPNRTGSPRDVVLNLLGSSLGVAGSLALSRARRFGLPAGGEGP